MKLIMVDLDGTLFDTKDVNYYAYSEAIRHYGYSIDYDYYCKYCNGRHYLDFLPQITTSDESILKDIHSRKKNAYSKYLSKAKLNKGLLEMLITLKSISKIALVTTASKKNTMDILNKFDVASVFDLIVTHEDIKKSKPDPEGYIKAMRYFGVNPSEAIIFEDSDVGVMAAEKSGAQCFIVKGYN